MANSFHSMASSAEAEPSTMGEEEIVEIGCSSQTRTPSSNDLDPKEEASIPSHGENCAHETPKGYFLRRRLRNMLKTVKVQGAKSEQRVGRKLDQLSPSQRKSYEMEKFLTSLSSMRRHYRVTERWPEIQGCNRWAGLLEPLDDAVRAEIKRYGKFAKATYDALDKIPRSGNYACKYTEEALLRETGLHDRGYEISQFLYGTARLRLPKVVLRRVFSEMTAVDMNHHGHDSNWIGFVAVCTNPKEIQRLGRIDIVVAWRGTVTKREWMKDLQFWSKPIRLEGDKGVKVESGFLSIYRSCNVESRYNTKSAKEQVLQAVENLVKKYEDKRHNLSITITGHSLGSALATLSAYDIAKSEWINHPPATSSSSSDGSNPDRSSTSEETTSKSFPKTRIPITVFSFAGPRVGNLAFKKEIEGLGVAMLRVVNKHDIVPRLPGRTFSSYRHVGVKLEIDNLKRDYQTDSTGEPVRSPSCFNWSMKYIHEQHCLADMLETVLPKRLEDKIVNELQAKSLSFRRWVRTSITINTFLKHRRSKNINQSSPMPPTTRSEDGS